MRKENIDYEEAFKFLEQAYQKEKKKKELERKQKEDKLNRFAAWCKDFNFLNIDKSKAHLERIVINDDNTVTVYCEKYDPLLDKFLSCQATVFTGYYALQILTEYNKMIVDLSYEARNLINRINSYLNYKLVEEKLEKVRMEKMKGDRN